jgi:hypothetical protein
MAAVVASRPESLSDAYTISGVKGFAPLSLKEEKIIVVVVVGLLSPGDQNRDWLLS